MPRSPASAAAACLALPTALEATSVNLPMTPPFAGEPCNARAFRAGSSASSRPSCRAGTPAPARSVWLNRGARSVRLACMSRERELEQRIRRLEEINDQNERLLGAISHELRNPLAAIRSAAEVLRLTLGAEPRVQKTYAILERQTSMMVKLLDRLSDISK